MYGGSLNNHDVAFILTACRNNKHICNLVSIQEPCQSRITHIIKSCNIPKLPNTEYVKSSSGVNEFSTLLLSILEIFYARCMIHFIHKESVALAVSPKSPA